jgi:hypothetical protein
MVPAPFDNFFTLNDGWCGIQMRAHIHHPNFTQG